MSIRNLDAIFKPNAVAPIGASSKPQSVGRVIMENLLSGGFEGPIMPVNPKHKSVGGVLAYPDIASLPLVPDLAVICTPAATVPGLIGELASRGTRGVVVISAGFSELTSQAGTALQQEMLNAAKPHLMRIVGPNSIGVISSNARMNASFAHRTSKPGHVAFVAQSGAMVTTVLDWATDRGIGFSHLVSLGSMSDVDFGDMLDYLANDPQTTAILLYIEAVTNARKFMSAARAASRLKPVIAIKAGRHAAAAQAATSHTGAMAGIDEVYDAAFRRAGILRVRTLEELFDAVETLAMPLDIQGERLAILTNGGGVGVLATDALLDGGGQLASLSPATVERLNTVLPPTWSHGNPVDIIGDAPASRYAASMDILLSAPEVDALLVLNCPTAVGSSTDAANAVAKSATAERRIVFTNWLGATAATEARRFFSAAKIPTYHTPDEAIRGFMHLVHRRRNQKTLMEVPPAATSERIVDDKAARSIVQTAADTGRQWLNSEEVQALFGLYEIPLIRSRAVETPDEAETVAAQLGASVALKIASPDITHKSDVGGVALNLATPGDVRTAATAMIRRVQSAAPNAKISGFVVQEMIRRPLAHELIVGMAVDRQFGPFILFGHGGTGVEAIADKTIALPPLNPALVRDMIARTRIYKQLQGYRDRSPVNFDALTDCLVKLSQLVCDLDGISELDINPLLADADGVVALDARVRVAVQKDAGASGRRLAITPYPKELERPEKIEGVGDFTLRPVRPEDAQGFLDLFSKLTAEDIQRRFFAPISQLTPAQLIRFTQIDYDREIALVLVERATNAIFAVARLVADPDFRKAEFALTVRSDHKGKGIGSLMLRRLVDYARARGLAEITGDILRENNRMVELVKEQGFALTTLSETSSVLRASLTL